MKLIVNYCCSILQDFPTNSVVEDDATSELSVADLSRFIPRVPSSSSGSHVISIGQLLESVITLFSLQSFSLLACYHMHQCMCMNIMVEPTISTTIDNNQ